MEYTTIGGSAELRLWGVSSVPFGIPFRLPVLFYNRSSSQFIICKWWVQKKFICCDCYMKKNVAFTLISFAVLKWHECLSFQLPFELTVEIPVQLHLELEVNLLVHNVIEREIEREKVQMKPPYDIYWFSKFLFKIMKGLTLNCVWTCNFRGKL